MLQCVGSGVKESIELYLRVLMAIDEEVVDRQIIHTREVSYHAAVPSHYMLVLLYMYSIRYHNCRRYIAAHLRLVPRHLSPHLSGVRGLGLRG